MPTCTKNNNYVFFTDSGQRIREASLSSDGKNILIKSYPGGSTECTFSIDSSSYTGLEATSNGLKLTDAISGLTASEQISVGNKPNVNVEEDNGALEVIGYEDVTIKLQGPKVNIRYNSLNDLVAFEY